MNDDKPWTDGFTVSVGSVTVATTDNRGHPPEFYAERITDRLIFIGNEVPEPIKVQAYAYREAMRQVVLDGIRKAILSHHTTLIAQLKKAGMQEAASLIYEHHRR